MERTHIIAAIEEAAALTGLKPSTICQYAVKNRKLYDNLVGGLDCQFGTAKRVLDWIAEAKADRARAS